MEKPFTLSAKTIIESNKERHHGRGVRAVAILICMQMILTFSSMERADAADSDRLFPWHGRKVFLFGCNYPWYNGWRGIDLGRYYGTKIIESLSWINGRDLQQPPKPIPPGTTGFDAAGIDAQMADMESHGLHAVRWFFGNDGRAFFVLDQNDNCQGVEPISLQHVDTVMQLAALHHIYLIPSIFDFRFVCGDDKLKYEDGTFGKPHAIAITDAQKRKRLLELYVKPLVRRYANSDRILFWEIMNEAGNVTTGKDPVTGFEWTGGAHLPPDKRLSVQQLQDFLNETYDVIKSVDPNHLVMPAGLARPKELPLVVNRVKADVYGAHYDDDGVTDYGNAMSVPQIQSKILSKYSLKLDRPLVMTESTSDLNTHLEYYVKAAYDGGWAGILPWSYSGLIRSSDFVRYSYVPTSRDASNPATIDYCRKFAEAHRKELDLDNFSF
jgi:hypothetical protein